MDDGIRLVTLEHGSRGHGITNVDFLEMVAGVVRDPLERLEIAGIGQLVDIDDANLPRVRTEEISDQPRSDKSGAASEQDCLIVTIALFHGNEKAPLV